MNNTIYTSTFKKVAILGSGVMGSQIAAHIANLNIPVVLLDLEDLAEQSIKKMKKSKPPALATARVADNIIFGDFDNDIGLISDCDLIIEAIVEDINIKKQFFNKIADFIDKDAVIATNTSGLSINAIADILPDKLKPNLFGIHFFNPPRFMPLVELISTKYSNKESLDKLEGFITSYLGKEVVHTFDTPGFIANRIGVVAMLIIMHHTARLNIAPDEVDQLTGEVIGKAKSATYRTMDVVGLDVLKHVVDNLSKHLVNDPLHKYMVLPSWILKLIDSNCLGNKTKKGIYEKKGKDIYVYDTEKKDYRLYNKTSLKDFCKKIRKGDKLLSTILSMHKKDKKDKYAEFLWCIHRDIIHYTALHTGDIAGSISDIDRALKFGFGWKKGVFESWQESGIKEIKSAIEDDITSNKTLINESLPSWLEGVNEFLTKDKTSYSPKNNKYIPFYSHKVYTRQLTSDNLEVLIEDDSFCLQKIDDGIAVINFKTTLNALNHDTLMGIKNSLDYLEKEHYFALIFASNVDGIFCAGANLFEVLAACKLGRLHKSAGLTSKAKQKAFELIFPDLPKMNYQGLLADVVKLGQELVMRMKHGSIYTIAAVDGLALGGGCELILHCNYTVATMNSYIGLVEVGVGLLPSFGGCKEMIVRANKSNDSFKQMSKFFEQIAMAKVSSSALEAMDMGYLKEESTSIIAHPKELLFSALSHARERITSTVKPPQISATLPVGQSGKANILSAITNFKDGGFISDHDELISSYIAEIFSGGVNEGIEVSQTWLLELERKHFMKLVETTKTQDRIEHMLKKHKPLRN